MDKAIFLTIIMGINGADIWDAQTQRSMMKNQAGTSIAVDTCGTLPVHVNCLEGNSAAQGTIPAGYPYKGKLPGKYVCATMIQDAHTEIYIARNGAAPPSTVSSTNIGGIAVGVDADICMPVEMWTWLKQRDIVAPIKAKASHKCAFYYIQQYLTAAERDPEGDAASKTWITFDAATDKLDDNVCLQAQPEKAAYLTAEDPNHTPKVDKCDTPCFTPFTP
jgi:hypothetical protein